MLNVLCANYGVLPLLPQFIIFTARWLKPNLNKYFKRIPSSFSTFPLFSFTAKDCLFVKDSDGLTLAHL